MSKESSSPTLFFTRKSLILCRKRLFSNSKIHLKEKSLLLNKGLKTIQKKNRKPSRLRKRKGKMRMRKLLSNNFLKLKKLKVSKPIPARLEVIGKLELRPTSIPSTLRQICLTMKLLRRPD